jgi:hypothetical protein
MVTVRGAPSPRGTSILSANRSDPSTRTIANSVKTTKSFADAICFKHPRKLPI